VKNFTKAAIESLGEETLMKLKPANKESILKMPQVLRDFPDQFVAKFVKSFYEEMLQSNKSYSIPSPIYASLTQSEFMLLKDEIEGLVNQSEYLAVWEAYNCEEHLQKYIGKELTIS
jgi:hypothetical protein